MDRCGMAQPPPSLLSAWCMREATGRQPNATICQSNETNRQTTEDPLGSHRIRRQRGGVDELAQPLSSTARSPPPRLELRLDVLML